MTRKIAKKWLKQAMHELDMAEKNISLGGYDIAAFLCHQAVEKLLKAIFASKGKKIPKTHYIDELGRNLNLDERYTEYISDLTIDYTFSRYPDVAEHVPFEAYNEEIAREKVKTAKKVFESMKDSYSNLLEDEDG